ncbi:hypothetical protein [Thalassotalea atypica]|uniref:hypothetical protein n=1 Tax=Thalassotalea atypica TaxID=2054316 RepID=UPI00257404CF|nr:hypothetical protein [Thalassotalea atypica]
MDFIKIGLLIILNKLLLLVIGLITGGVVGYFTNSTLLGVIVALLIIGGLYFYILGPVHFVTKEKLQLLVEKELIVATPINPFTKALKTLNLKNKWEHGEGVLDQFKDSYSTQLHQENLFFFNRGMPYLPLYFLPLSSIYSIQKDSEFIKDLKFQDDKNIYEIVINGQHKIALPMDSESAEIVMNSIGLK